MKFVNPKNDVAFKKIFGSGQNTAILISFLNAVLNLHDEHAIQTIQLLNPYQTPPIDSLKYTLRWTLCGIPILCQQPGSR